MGTDRATSTALSPVAASQLVEHVERGSGWAPTFAPGGLFRGNESEVGTGEVLMSGGLNDGARSIQTPPETPLPTMCSPHIGVCRTCTLHVCRSCRAPGSPREPREHRAGYRLYEEIVATLRKSRFRARVEVRAADCLSMCRRPCGIALSSPGAWTYLFGDQGPGQRVCDILECVSLYIDTQDGFIARKRRPHSLRASILGRVPPVMHRT